MTPLKWKDISSFSQGDKVRTPTTFEARIGPVRVVVTRRQKCDGWYLNCDPWHSLKPLGEMSADEAKRVAGRQIRSDARALMEALGAE